MRYLFSVFFLVMSLLNVPSGRAIPTADVTQNQVVLSFPESATFQLEITDSAEITSIVLEYGSEQQTCGEVIAKAFPKFTPGQIVITQWTWEMRQSGSLPPGAQLWWRWHLKDANGNETVTETNTATWLDDVHPWQTVTSGLLSLHYYAIENGQAEDMLAAGVEGMDRNQKSAGLTTDSPINIYVYSNYEDLREAILYEPSWVGGQAYPDENIVILGSSGSDTDWDENTVVHELTHVLVGHFTFSCLGDVPQWLNEGLAVYSEGPLSAQFQAPLNEAIQNNTLFSLRIISGNFSEEQSRVDLSYAESHSIVKYLIDTFGKDKMTALLVAFRDGATPDEALLQTYGFNLDGLESQWRQAIGAQPGAAPGQPTAQPTPTFVPTIIPISGVARVLQATPTPIPTSTSETAVPTRTGPPLSLTLILLGLCCAFAFVIGV